MRYIPAAVSSLILAAHFLRWGNLPGVLCCLALPIAALASKRLWVLRAWQLLLAAGCLLWIATAVRFGAERLAAGEPYLRMALILGSVAGLSALSAWMLSGPSVRGRYR